MFDYDYIMANDSERALNKSKEKYFMRCLHLLCWLHLHENLTNNCRYKKGKDKRKLELVIHFVMKTMAEAESHEVFDNLKIQFDNEWPEAFLGDYFDTFASNLRTYVVEPRLIASHSIPKAFKTNAIESSNARAKLYLGHKARNLYEAVYLMMKMADDIKDHIIMALYNEGIWQISPDSNIKPINRIAWVQKSPEQQEAIFLQKLGIGKVLTGARREVVRPVMPDSYNLSVEETKQAKMAHQRILQAYNDKKKHEQFLMSQETNRPILNLNSQVASKPHQHNRPTANKTRKSFTHLAK